ncbi:MAG: hypothetical protein SNJ74_12715 [Fimbriimonadaceae bacterium]
MDIRLTVVLGTVLLGTASIAPAQDGDLGNDILRARVNTVYGPSGLINVPHAYVASKDRIVIGVTLGKDRSASANVGLFDSVEIGGTYYERRDRTDGKILGNAKVNIIPANWRNFEVGIGVIDAADAVNQTVFGVASFEAMTPAALDNQFAGLRLHGGYGSGLFRDKIIGGGELLFNNRMSLIGEYDGVDGNFAFRYVHNENVRAQIGTRGKTIFFTLVTAVNF